MQRQNCQGCINATVCGNNASMERIYLNVSVLFNRSLLMGQCELRVNGKPNNQTIDHDEPSCVELANFSNSNYSVTCPICNRSINHVIPNSNNSIKVCSDLGMYICG